MKKVHRRLWFIGLILVMIFSAGVLYAGTEPSLELLSPKRGEEVPYGDELVIAVSIYDPDGDADITSIEFEVDGSDITPNANTSAFLVTYSFEATAPGRHEISFLIEDREGNVSKLQSYFNVSPEPVKEKKVTAKGSLRIGGGYDKEATQSAVGNADLNVFGGFLTNVDYSLSVLLTNEEATDMQRVSSYRFDLYSPFGGFVVGDTTPAFTDYSIDGMEVLGIHAFPQLGFLGFEFVYGRSLRAVESPDDPETFKRNVYGGKFKLGKERKLQWGLAFLKVKDDKGSIDPTAAGPTPKDNIVLGTNLRLSILDGKVSLYGEANESLLNEDITGGPSDFEDFDLPFKPSKWEWLFTINEHIVPIIPGLTSLAAKTAVKIGPFYDNTLNAEYSYVGPSYFSLGNTAVINDRAGYRIWDNIWLMNRLLFLNFAYQNYKNNLEDTLTYTTKNNGYSGSIYVYPTDYLSFNAGFDMFTVSNGAPATETSAIDTINATISSGVTQSLDIFSTTSSIYFNGTASLFKDEITAANDLNNYSTRLGAISYFDKMPLDTKAVVGYDFGDSPNSIYVEGKGGFRFLPAETLYAYAGVVYETGPEELDLTIGTNFEAPYGIELEAEFEYITSPGSEDILISAFATKEF